jgi:hypothetical protein
VIEKGDVFVLAQWVSKYLRTWKEMGINQFSIYRFWKQTRRFLKA